MSDAPVMTWTKLGRVFDPSQHRSGDWMREFAQCPTPFLLDERRLRVYFACRPPRDGASQYVSHPGYVDLDRHEPQRVLAVSPQPLLPLGGLGAFDEFGVMPCSVVRHGDEVWMYYTGWTRMGSVPYTVGIGVARSRDGGDTFERIGEGPVLGLALHEPFLVNSPAVLCVEGRWHMWYLTGTGWIPQAGKPEPLFHLVHAESANGLDWERNAKPILPAKTADECQDVFLPFHANGAWHSVFAYRGATGFRTDPSARYRFGYARSTDLVNWVRDDRQVAWQEPQLGDWDEQMACSSQVLDVDGRLLMFYCGNEIGRWGFGIAELQAFRGDSASHSRS
jgi:predicted GH43/DUF377 family glycosyl hydrolase